MAAFHGSLVREINQRCKPDKKGRLHSIIKNTAAWCVDELWKRMEPLIFEIDPPKKQEGHVGSAWKSVKLWD